MPPAPPPAVHAAAIAAGAASASANAIVSATFAATNGAGAAAAPAAPASNNIRGKIAECLAVAERFLKREFVADRLLRMSEEIPGLFFHSEDGDNALTLTLNGNVFVVDVELLENGDVAHLKLSFASEVQADKSAEQLLFTMLRDNHLDEFHNAMNTLMFWEKASSHAFDLFDVMRVLGEDLEKISAMERRNAAALAPGSDPSAVVLTEGHGLVLTNMRKLGPSLVFWVNSGFRKRFEEESARGRISEMLSDEFPVWWLTLTIGEGGSSQFIPKGLSSYIVDDFQSLVGNDRCEVISGTLLGADLNFVTLKQSAYPAVNASFYLEMGRAIPLSSTVVGTLRVSLTSEALSTGPARDLLDCLLDLSAKETSTPLSRNLALYKSPVQFDVSVPPHPAMGLTFVRIQHICQIFLLLKILRRQLIFNDLVQSCLLPPTESSEELMAAVSIDDWTPPDSFGGTLTSLLSGQQHRFLVRLEADNKPNVVFGGPLDDGIDADAINSVLQSTMNVRTAFDRAFQQMKMDETPLLAAVDVME